MRCANCGTEIQGRPPTCPRCGTRLWYGDEESAPSQPPFAPQGSPWQGAPPQPQPPYPGYAPMYPPEGQAPPPPPPPGYVPGYPQQMPSGPAYGAPAPPSAPYGAYAPPSMPAGSTPSGYAPGGYQQPYPPAYGQVPGQPYPLYGVGAPATTPFAPAAAAPKRRANPLVIVLSVFAALVVIAAAGAGAVYFLGSRSSGPTAGGPVSSPAATATLGPTLLYQNAMTTPDSAWAQDQHCFFRSDGYHIVDSEICFAPIADQTNVDIKVDMIALSGDLGSPHGIVFRHDTSHQRYEFDVDPYGHWVFFKCVSGQSQCARVVDYTSNSAIHGGLHKANTLEVLAVGTHFTFMVNGTQVGTADDSTLSVGSVGLAGDNNSEVVFSNLKITMPR